jgi:hypothetical protein
MNAANYNWTEPINRASDKPGEIQNTLREPLFIQPLHYYFVNYSRGGRRILLEGFLVDKSPSVGPDFVAFRPELPNIQRHFLPI